MDFEELFVSNDCNKELQMKSFKIIEFFLITLWKLETYQTFITIANTIYMGGKWYEFYIFHTKYCVYHVS